MTPKPHKICIATSTRADWGLLAPLAKSLKEANGIELQILATNMHLLPRYGHTIDEITALGFDITTQVLMPDTDDSPVSKAAAMAQCLKGSAEALEILRPDMLIILGDRYEMLSIASAATIMGIPIVHIAGGEISEGAIDDNIRHAITKLSSLHLTATETYRKRVIQMGENPSNVINTGAIGVWNLMNQHLMTCEELSNSLNFQVDPEKTLLVTYHPATKDEGEVGERCDALLSALDDFKDYKLIITYPNNDAGSEKIIERIKEYTARQCDRVLLIKSLGMIRYLSALQFVKAVIGNSSSGIVEVPSMGIPTVNIGIRQKGRIAAKSVINCGDTTAEIISAIRKALSTEYQTIAAKKENPYYKADTLKIMTDSILSVKPETLKNKKFYDLP